MYVPSYDVSGPTNPIRQAGAITVAEIGCGRYAQYTDVRVLTTDPHRSRQYGIPPPGDEQEPTPESPRVRLLSARGQISPSKAHQKNYSRYSRIFQRNPAYESPPIGNIRASVWDLSSDQLPTDLEPGSVDIAVLIFVLSALHPDEWFSAVKNAHRVGSWSC